MFLDGKKRVRKILETVTKKRISGYRNEMREEKVPFWNILGENEALNTEIMLGLKGGK